MTQVFISYSRKDLAFVERLADSLKAAGLEVWYDLSGLDGGTRWGREIQSAIEQCQCFVVVLSPNSVESEWVEKEFMYANSLKKRIIPLLYQPCKTPMWFINLHFIDVQGENYDRNFWVLLKAMGVKAEGGVAKAVPAAAASTPLPAPDNIKFRPAWILALLGLAAVVTLAIWGMPALAVRLAPTPTSSPTPTPTTHSTYTPTLPPTSTPTSSPTQTLIPSPIPTPTTGTVAGEIKWSDKPFANVQVMLCTGWTNTCTGDKFTDITKSDGSFSILGILPGEYMLVTKYPGQAGETRYFTGENLFPFTTTISAGDKVDLGPIGICKTDLYLYAPIINGTSVKFSWKQSPGATEYIVKLGGDNSWQNSWSAGKGLSFETYLEPGSYQVTVFVFGSACNQGTVIFTVPQPQ